MATFADWLNSPEAEEEWNRNLASAIDAILKTRVRDLVGGTDVAELIEAMLEEPTYSDVVRPIGAFAVQRAVEDLKTRGKLSGFVPGDVQAKVDRLLEKPNLVPPKLIREVLEHDAAEEIMRDVLFDTLKEFSEKVNPFFAEWGLPSLLKKVAPFGLGNIAKTFEGLKGEFDKRLEPEIRKFLQTFSRIALRKVADFTIARMDQPKFVALRKRVFRFLLEQDLGTLLSALDDDGYALSTEIALDITQHVGNTEAEDIRRRAVIEGILSPFQELTLKEAMERVKAKPSLPTVEIARAVYPVVRSSLKSSVVRTWLAEFSERAGEEP